MLVIYISLGQLDSSLTDFPPQTTWQGRAQQTIRDTTLFKSEYLEKYCMPKPDVKVRLHPLNSVWRNKDIAQQGVVIYELTHGKYLHFI